MSIEGLRTLYDLSFCFFEPYTNPDFSLLFGHFLPNSAKTEEYDLLQAAVSDKERYESSWELSLRGGGPRLVAVGHLFSGII